MKPPDTIMIDGRAFSWRRLCRLRREQLEAYRKACPSQPLLFEVKDDARPKPERNAASRYREPSLLVWLKEGGS